MSRPPILTTRSIALADAALRAVLTRTLEGTGLDFHRWIALKIVADKPTFMPVADLVETMRECLKLEAAEAAAAIEELRTLDLVDRAHDRVGLTLHGSVLHRRLSEETGVIARQIYAGLDPDDLAATHRVLSTVAGRANAWLAAMPERPADLASSASDSLFRLQSARRR